MYIYNVFFSYILKSNKLNILDFSTNYFLNKSCINEVSSEKSKIPHFLFKTKC